MVRAIVAAIACVACQGQPAGQGAGPGSTQGAGPGPGSMPAGAGRTRDAPLAPGDPPMAPGDAIAAGDARGSAGAAGVESEPHGRPEEPETPDPGRVIAELGAVAVWQAAVDRAQLLGRRSQHGVVYGRVGPPVMVAAPPMPVAPAGSAARPGAGSATGGAGSAARPGAGSAGSGAAAPAVAAGAASEANLVATPYVWLIDDTEGNGALGIRILLAGKAREGDRIAAGGAWQLDAERRWYWKPDAIQPLPPAPPSDLKDPPSPVPSHAIATGALPPGARTASVARDNDAIYFQIVGPPPAGDGDGWQIADQLGSPTVLVMNLPGERPSYGGQDMRAADERWQLRRGQTYWVRIGKLHKRSDKPPAVNARTPPVRVP